MNDLCAVFFNADSYHLSSACYSPDYEANKKTIEKFLAEYSAQKPCEEILLSSSTLGTGVSVDGVKIEDYFRDDVCILKYCLARIEEIEAINRFSHTPSAFGCMLSFLAFLGQATHNSDRDEEAHFKEYCVKHLRRLRCVKTKRMASNGNLSPRTSFGADKNSWGEVLYRLVRCGLIHAMSSIGNRDPSQDEVEIRLTHSTLANSVVYEFFDSQNNARTTVLEPTWSAATLTISAFDLCDAIRDSILHIYADGTDLQHMHDYFTTHPPLMPVFEH